MDYIINEMSIGMLLIVLGLIISLINTITYTIKRGSIFNVREDNSAWMDFTIETTLLISVTLFASVLYYIIPFLTKPIGDFL